MIISSPLCVNLGVSRDVSSSFSLLERIVECGMENRNSTFVFTLFTFCPPAPLLRLAKKDNSFVKSLFINLLFILSKESVLFYQQRENKNQY